MAVSYATFVLFTTFSGLRILAYLPQIVRVARDTNGATAISYTTWILWTGANIATALYAAVNLGDGYLALVSAVYATCCITVIVLTALKRRRRPARLLRPWRGGVRSRVAPHSIPGMSVPCVHRTVDG